MNTPKTEFAQALKAIVAERGLDAETVMNAIKQAISTYELENTIVAILTYDDIETYASILALWYSKLVFLPLNPKNPPSRNLEILNLTECRMILSSNTDSNNYLFNENMEIIYTKDLMADSKLFEIAEMSPDDRMYILFTSGSTGQPKGVPVKRKNLDAFIHAFFDIGFDLNEEDKFLQMFDLTFDVSIQSFLLPLCIGACVYTIPENEIKFLYAYKLLKTHSITFASMVPSAISFLQPYFGNILLEKLRFSFFSGEALDEHILKEWSHCVPNAVIGNFYGPTEATIVCTYY